MVNYQDETAKIMLFTHIRHFQRSMKFSLIIVEKEIHELDDPRIRLISIPR